VNDVPRCGTASRQEGDEMNDLSKNKDLVRSYIAALNARDADAIVASLADDFVNHGAIPGKKGKDAMPAMLGKLWKAMPDMKWKCEDVIAEDDRVMCRLTMSGTQTGPLEFAVPIPATGREIVTEQIHVFRIANGKVVEHWLGRDDIGVLRQLGVAPFGRS
jgi:steroid delta-isomerase-like uncharacterized protein